jgi:hypothetical protein
MSSLDDLHFAMALAAAKAKANKMTMAVDWNEESQQATEEIKTLREQVESLRRGNV